LHHCWSPFFKQYKKLLVEIILKIKIHTRESIQL
jgi:hypothetical protein